MRQLYLGLGLQRSQPKSESCHISKDRNYPSYQSYLYYPQIESI